MVEVWGAWQYAAGNGMRIGYNIRRTAVNHGSNDVTFTVDVFTQNQYDYDDPQHLFYNNGVFAGRRVDYYNADSGGGVIYRDTVTYTWVYSDYETSHFASSDVRVEGTYNGVSPWVSIDMYVPPRPTAAPYAPLNLVTTWWDDNSVTLKWDINPTLGRPYDRQYVDVTRGWPEGPYNYDWMATLPGSAQSATLSGLTPNDQFYFRVVAENEHGLSAYDYISNDPYPTTTPAAPSNVQAGIATDGQSIEITWDDNSPVPHNPVGAAENPNVYDVSRQTSPGGSWHHLNWALPDDTTSVIDPNPADGYNRYRVRLTMPPGYGGLGLFYTEGWVYSNTISTIVPPLAPTNLQPDGLWLDLLKDQTLTWVYHDGGDGAAQSHFQIRYRRVSDSTWTTTNKIQSGQQQYVLPGGTLDNAGEAWEWQVRTQGSTTVGYGPWSNSAILKGTTTPTVSIQAGTPSDPLQQLPPTVWWHYTQAEGTAQTQWNAQLLDGQGNIIAIRQGSGGSPDTRSSELYPDVNLSEAHNTSVYVNDTAGATSTAGTPTIATGTGTQGQNAVRFEPGSSGTLHGPDLLQSQHPTVTPGQLVTFSFLMKYTAPATPGSTVEIRVQSDSSTDWTDGTTLFSAPVTDYTEGQWVAVSTAATVPMSVSAVDIAPTITGVASGETYEITKPSIVQQRTGWHTAFTEVAVEDGETYTVRVRAQSVYGLWSEWDSATFTVDLLPPAPVQVNLSYDRNSGAMVISLTAQEPTPGESAAVATVKIQRRIPRETSWVTIFKDVELEAGVEKGLVDTLPTVYGMNQYRLIVTSVSPSKEISQVYELAVLNYEHGCQAWFFVNYGSGFTNVLRFQSNASVSESLGRSGSTVELLGRKWPVLQQGQQRSKSLSVSAGLKYDPQADPNPQVDQGNQPSSPNEWREAALDSTVVCYRDPYGRRVFGSMSDLSIDDQMIGLASLSFTVNKVDYDESPSVVE